MARKHITEATVSSSSFGAMLVNFLLLTICVAFYFFFSTSSSSSSGWNVVRIYFDLFSLLLTLVALLFLELWGTDPARRARAAAALLVPLILAFDTYSELFDGDSSFDHYFHAYLLFLAGVAAVFARVCVADGLAGAGAGAARATTAALLVLLFLQLGAAVVFFCYPNEWTDGGDADSPQFVLLAAGVMLAWAYL